MGLSGKSRLICVDHWPGRMVHAIGHPTVLSPTIDQLVANGVAFTNAYATTPLCVPARRELMTGTFSPTHGSRGGGSMTSDGAARRMPDVPTMAQTFRDAGYQTFAVGKLHVHPQRDRIGFDDALLNEEGRMANNEDGVREDDYEHYLTDQGYSGMEFSHGHSNDYNYAAWPLPDHTHSTNWTARETAKAIARRDPTRPAFWYMSFTAPHPPMNPLESYMNIYRDIDVDMPFIGEWAQEWEELPYALKSRPRRIDGRHFTDEETRTVRRAFYALSTQVDHQIRAVIGTLKEQGLVDDTIVMFTCDHGDLLGNHHMYTKMVFYEDSAKIPMVLAPTEALMDRVGYNRLDDRLVAQADVMPTLLDLCDIPIPETVEGLSMVGDERHDHLYGEMYDGPTATRMIRDRRHKLVYYPAGNYFQLFDIEEDPDEMRDVSEDRGNAEVRERLTQLLIGRLYGTDVEWLDGDRLVGMPEPEWTPKENVERSLGGQRGLRFR